MKSSLVQKADTSAALVDSLNTSLIFTFKGYLAETFAGLGHLILFPIAAVASLLRAGFAVYQARKEGYKKGGILQALIEGLSALAVSIAVLGVIVASAVFATVAPIIFTAVSAFKALYLGLSTVYHGLRSYFADDAQEKAKAKNQALHSFAGFLINTLATVALGLVMIGGSIPFAALGIAAGIFGAIYVAYLACKREAPKKSAAIDAATKEPQITTTGDLHQRWGIQPGQRLASLPLGEEDNHTGHSPLPRIELTKTVDRESSVVRVEGSMVRPQL